jgi:hypothetical protein
MKPPSLNLFYFAFFGLLAKESTSLLKLIAAFSSTNNEVIPLIPLTNNVPLKNSTSCPLLRALSNNFINESIIK